MKVIYKTNRNIASVNIGDMIEYLGDVCFVVRDNLNENVRLVDVVTFGTTYTFEDLEELRETCGIKMVAKSHELELIVGQ